MQLQVSFDESFLRGLKKVFGHKVKKITQFWENRVFELCLAVWVEICETGWEELGEIFIGGEGGKHQENLKEKKKKSRVFEGKSPFYQ